MALVTGAFDDSPVPKLQQLSEVYNLPKAAKREVADQLSNEMKVIHVFLLKVAELPPDRVDELAWTLAREAREVSYDIEDRIDTFIVGAYGCHKPINKGGWFKRARKKMSDLPNKGRDRGDIVAAIKDIKKRVCEIAEQISRYSFDQRLVRPVPVDPRLPALYRNERELVGIEEAREEVVRLLTQAGDAYKREVKVVSIVGVAGVGKTTLAKAVYNRLQAQFDCSAFVSVSQFSILEKIFKDILLELDEAKYHTSILDKRMDVRHLINEIRQFLEIKRYLIVIDDIWSVADWDIIRLALIDAGNGSRIITTSRKSDVAVEGRRGTYRLKPLSYVNSEKLFYKRIFGGEGICPGSKFAEVSDKILMECSGLPLAIITVASVLACKPREKWSEVCNSVALRHESNRYVDNMRRVLSFSFYHLPPHLRTCLLHLSIFPENCFIEKDFLIWKWVAEGCVVDLNRRKICLFESGESCFNVLVNSGTIQIAEECLNKGRVYGCRVHPVMFSLMRVISSEENFCTVLEADELLHTSQGNNHPRRIGMHSMRNNVEHNIVPEANNIISMEKVRSFNASLCFIDGMPRISSFQVLRVLAIEYCPGLSAHHLVQIGNLVQLRYLGLVGAGVLELPEETLGGLRFLQTLDLRETDIEKWPRNISNLQHLMCLCADRTRTVPQGIRSLRSLEDLRLHIVSSCETSKLTAELGRLECLRVIVLGFEKMDVELEEALLESLPKFRELQRLEIYYCKPSTRAITWEESLWAPHQRLEQLVLGGLLFSRLPSWIDPSSLPILSHLHLGVEVLEDGDLQILGRLPSLRSLVLMVAASDEQEHPITCMGADYGFPELNFFSTNVPVRFESGLLGALMPSLEHVEFYVPVAQIAYSWLSSLANLPSLRKVTVVLDCRGVSTAETEESEEKLRRATGVHPIHSLQLEVTKENGNDDQVPLVVQFPFKNPRFEALRSEMEKMQTNRQVQVQHYNDSHEEITPAGQGV